MIEANFESYQEYLEWCENMVTKIYYANIAMDNEAIKDVVTEIARRNHVKEGDLLVGFPGMNEKKNSLIHDKRGRTRRFESALPPKKHTERGGVGTNPRQ